MRLQEITAGTLLRDGTLSICRNRATTTPMRNAVNAARSPNHWAIGLSRAGMLALLVGFADFIFSRYRNPEVSSQLAPIQGLDLVIIALTLGLTWQAVYRRNWRRINFALCATMVASEAAIGIYDGYVAVVVVAMILLLAGIAALASWNRWGQVIAAGDHSEESEIELLAARGAGKVIPMLTSNDLNIRLPLLRSLGLVHHVIKPARRGELFGVIRTLLGYGAGASDSAAIANQAATMRDAVAAESPVHKSFDTGCDTHVSKPVRRPTLLGAIRDVTATLHRDQHLAAPMPARTEAIANS